MRKPLPAQQETSATDEYEDIPGAQALLRGLDVLLAVGSASRPLRFGDLERAVSIPRASLYRLLAALASRRLIRYDARTRTYQVGTRVLELSRRTLDQSGIIRAAKPELARLSRRLKRTVCAMVLDGQEVFVLDFDDPDPSYGRLVRLWPRSGLLESAAGRALLAAMPADRCEALIKDIAPDNKALERLRANLAIAKALGYAVLDREAVSGCAGAAAAMVDDDGYPTAAISCLFESDNVSSEELHETGRILAEGARRASGHMGMGFPHPAVRARPDIAISADVEVLPTGRDFVGENPVWNARRSRLYWVDVLAPALRWWDPAARAAGRVDLPQLTAGIAFDDQDRIVGAGQSGIFLIDPETGASSMLLNPEADRPENRFNTAGVDCYGRLWAGTLAINHQPGKGSLYSIGGNLAVERRLERVGLPRNVAFSPDCAILYFADVAEKAVFAFDLDAPTGEIRRKRIFLHGEDLPGQPNGIAVDSEACLWIACSGGWCIQRRNPTGKLEAEIALPIPMPTNCAFGGPDLSTLFVTSNYLRMPVGLSSQAPASGQLIAIRTTTRGQAPARFRMKMHSG